MYIEVFPKLGQIHISPDNEEEAYLLRSFSHTDVKDEDKMLVWWGDTEPRGKMNQGLKISWIGNRKCGLTVRR